FSSAASYVYKRLVVEEPVEEPIVEVVEDEEDEEEEDEIDEIEEDEDEEEEEEVPFEGGIKVIRFDKSFSARLIQRPDTVKEWYGILKNELLSYKKVKDKMTWKRENFRIGRKCIARFVVRGKTLCLMLALDPANYAGTKYKVEDFSHVAANADTPCFIRIKTTRRVNQAKDLIADLMEEFGAARTSHKDVDYYEPYDTTANLVERKLVKRIEKLNGPVGFGSIVEEIKQEEPANEVVEEEIIEEVVQEEVAAENVAVATEPKEDDWSKYDGEYEGVYYDPEDACYYEGTPSPEIAEKLAQKQKELEEEAKNNRVEVIVKKIAPPFLPLKTPKNERKTPESVEGFDLAIIYGKYVVEHLDKEDGTQEWFYTLYNPSGEAIYLSNNYSEREYCIRAIPRFQTHVLVGEFHIEMADEKFHFELSRKTYVHKGELQNTFEEANAVIAQIKSYAQTDIIREQ
ncbi:MAG: hypothetical protein K2M36_04115, partial [Clostridia bacterium]|nr:hypothetical protein [Clostridia bacterium]